MQTNYTPDNIPHRDEQVKQVANILAPVLRGERVSNLFVYGGTGTGKTLSIQHVREMLLKKAQQIGVDLRIEYLNCKLKKVADTEYRMLAALIQQMGGKVADTGLPTPQVYSKFIEIIDEKKQVIVIIFDEIDQAVKKISDDFLYNLTRLNSELSRAQISIVGISNDSKFLDEGIDPRVKSSLSEEEILFPTYNALQLQDILNERCKAAFKEGTVDEGVISKCAALAAREHGDARRALDLLRVAGELSERDGNTRVELKYIDAAQRKIEKDKVLDLISTAPKHFQLVLYSVIELTKSKELQHFFTGDVYNVYQDICKKTKTEILTQRRVSDIVAEIDMVGLINARVISKGRHGRTKEIILSVPENLVSKMDDLLAESLGL